MKLNKKSMKLLLMSSIIPLGVNLLYVISSSSAKDLYIDMNIINPTLNYVSLYIPDEKLNELTESGKKISTILMTTLSEYEAGVKPLYIDDVLIVNKNYCLPKTFNGNDSTQEAEVMFNKMKTAASLDGITLTAFSTYRSYDKQAQLYSKYIAKDGQEAADRYSARPGFSEHQTTLAYDIGGRDSSKWASFSFYETSEAKWLSKNAHKYGFILRYPEGKESFTGYRYESWHFRYIGKELSSKIHQSGLSLEEFYGLDKISELEKNLPLI